LTDGAAASLLMSEEKAKELGFTPWAYLRDWSFRACDPWEELLLGPTYCTHDVLQRNNMKIEDIGVFEIHEGTKRKEYQIQKLKIIFSSMNIYHLTNFSIPF
jgi:acetyl-CoA acetyltransferase